MRFQRHHFELDQSIMTFLCPTTRLFETGAEAVKTSRHRLQTYIREHPEFTTSHVPLSPEPDAPAAVRHMCEASAKMGVGPMASVAGAIALEALEAILAEGASEAVVDNGGDIALFIREPLRVGIYAGFKGAHNLGFEIKPRDGILGVCTSSGTVGPSFSYGRCDAAVVIAEDVLLADAAATALGNQISVESDLHNAFGIFKELGEIEGAVAILGDKIALWGAPPRLTRMDVDRKLITMGE